jgi:hypothetical protein
MSVSMTIGQSRMGKTYRMIPSIIAGVGKTPNVVLDPQDSLSELVLRMCAYRGLCKHVRFIQLNELSRRFGFIHLTASTSADPLLRQKEDADTIYNFARIPMDARGLNPYESPLIWEYLQAGIKLVMHSQSPAYYLPHAFNRDSDHFNDMLRNCRDERTTEKMRLVSKMSAQQYRSDTGPALRITETLSYDPSFIMICGGLNLHDLFDQRITLIFQGAGANPIAVRMAFLAVIQCVLTYNKRIGLHVDELCNFGLASKELAVGLASRQKYGFCAQLATQTLTGDPDTVSLIMQNSQTRRYFRTSDLQVLDVASRELGIGSYDPDALMRSYMDGEKERQDFMKPSDHDRSVAQRIMRLPVGSYCEQSQGVVRWMTPSLGRLPWIGSWERRRNYFLNQIYQSPEYSKPTVLLPSTGKQETKISSTSAEKIHLRSNRRKDSGSPRTKRRGDDSTN